MAKEIIGGLVTAVGGVQIMAPHFAPWWIGLPIFLFGLWIIWRGLTGHEEKPTPAPKQEFIPLSVATRQIYGGLRVANPNHPYVTRTECFADKPGGDLDYMAAVIAHAGFDIYGKHPPSTRLEKLDGAEITRKGGFENGGSEFCYFGQGQKPRYIDLHIRRSEVGRIIQILLSHEPSTSPAISSIDHR